MEANAEACEASVEKSLSMVTSLNPLIGYEKAAATGQRGVQDRQDDSRTVPRKIGLAGGDPKEVLDPFGMTQPHA